MSKLQKQVVQTPMSSGLHQHPFLSCHNAKMRIPYTQLKEGEKPALGL